MKKNLLLVTTVLCSCLFMAGCGNEDVAKDKPQDDIPVVEEDTSVVEEDTSVVSNEVAEYPTITILGEEYNFPMTYAEFMSKGNWENVSYGGDDNTVPANLSDAYIFCNGELKYVEIIFDNPTDEEQPLSECLVGGIWASMDCTMGAFGYCLNTDETFSRFGHDLIGEGLRVVPENSIKIGSVYIGQDFNEAVDLFQTELDGSFTIDETHISCSNWNVSNEYNAYLTNSVKKSDEDITVTDKVTGMYFNIVD